MTDYPPCAFCRARQATTLRPIAWRDRAVGLCPGAWEVPIEWMAACSPCYGYTQALPYAYFKYLAKLARERADGR